MLLDKPEINYNLNSFLDADVYTIAIDNNGGTILGGGVTVYPMQYRIVKFSPRGVRDLWWSDTFALKADLLSKFNGNINSLLVQPDGKIIIAGTFGTFNDDSTKKYLLRFNANGTEDTAFNNNASVASKFNSNIGRVYRQSDGKILVGGFFTNYAGGTNRSYMIRLNSDGTLDTSSQVSGGNISGAFLTGGVNCFLHTGTGASARVYFGGAFNSWGWSQGGSALTNTYKSKLIKVYANSNLSDDTFINNAVKWPSEVGFNGNTFNSDVNSIIELQTGEILVAGSFQNHGYHYTGVTPASYGGGSKSARLGISRLICFDVNGVENSTFTSNAVRIGTTANFNESIIVTKQQQDGKILVGGLFTNYKGVSGKSYLIRLNADGTEDVAFNNKFVNKLSGAVRSIEVDTRGYIHIGGSFGTVYPGRSKYFVIDKDGEFV